MTKNNKRSLHKKDAVKIRGRALRMNVLEQSNQFWRNRGLLFSGNLDISLYYFAKICIDICIDTQSLSWVFTASDFWGEALSKTQWQIRIWKRDISLWPMNFTLVDDTDFMTPLQVSHSLAHSIHFAVNKIFWCLARGKKYMNNLGLHNFYENSKNPGFWIKREMRQRKVRNFRIPVKIMQVQDIQMFLC